MADLEATTGDSIYPWHKAVCSLLPDLTGKRILEIGCGRGDFAILLARRYPSAEILATDFSTKAIEAAGNKPAPSNVRFAVRDAQGPPDGSQYDMVISCECLEHATEPRKMLRHIAESLKPAGEFVITTENYFNGMALAWLNAWLRGKPFDSGSGIQPHENFFLFWRVRRMMEQAGLRVTHMQSNHFVWLLLPGFAPDTFFTRDFTSPVLKRLFRPFGRHFTFKGVKRPV
jgi:2-polyprenyl-3-methyl-5-hydroxy-6-metoxy-1,4-benzoquinol methylase